MYTSIKNRIMYSVILFFFVSTVFCNTALARERRPEHHENNTESSVNELLSNEEYQTLSEEEIENMFSEFTCSIEVSPDNTDVNGVITSPLTYLKNNYGKKTDTYSTSTVLLSGMSRKTCSDLGGHNNCTLTALYNVMKYYQFHGYKKITGGNTRIYNVIKEQASELGYDYESSTGLSVTKNNNLVKNVWRDGFGYSSGNGSNNYLWTNSSATKAIDNGRPFLFSIANGVYFDHTVAVFGYRIYTNNRTGDEYTFLIISDGWSNSMRYLAWTGTDEIYLACMTSITPPTSK